MYTEIFREVVDIMHHDYAGYIDKKGWDNPEEFESKIMELEKNANLTPHSFLKIVEDYLLDFKDPHIFFNLIQSETQKQLDNGFRVRRYQDKLYVTTLSGEKRLKPGDAILSLNNTPIPELVRKHQRELMETKAEREDWRKIIRNYDVAEIIHLDGSTEFMELKAYEKPAYVPQHTITKVDEDTLCMTLTDFNEPDTLTTLLSKHEQELTATKNLIIDVRINYGGSTLAYQSLEKYLFPDHNITIDMQDYFMKFNITDRNADLMIQSINEELTKIDNEEYRTSLTRWKEEVWVKHKGKGFVSIEDEEVYEITGTKSPEHIVLLTDNYCGSAGDVFVWLCKKSPKITVLGRPTMGLNDYSNLIDITWNNQFQLMYPTSRLNLLDKRKPGAEPGIKPDIYIPWTPEHIRKDIDMCCAMEILNEKNKAHR